MKIAYDKATDTFTVLLTLEILDASRRVTDARKVEFSFAG